MRLVLTLTALLTLWAAPALACSCPDSAFTPEASRANIEAAHYIFSGRVLGIDKGATAAPEAEDALRPRENPAFSRMTVSIKKRFKGPNDARNLVVYADTGTDCGAPPEELVKTELFMVREEQGDYVLAPACEYFLTPEDQAALRRGDFKNMKAAQPVKAPEPQAPPAVPVEEVKAEPVPPAQAPEPQAQPEPQPEAEAEAEPEAEAQEAAPAPQNAETADYAAPQEPEQTAEPAAPQPAPAEEQAQAQAPAQPAPAAPAGTSLSLFKNGAPFEIPPALAAELTAGLSKTARGCWLYQGERTEDDWSAATAEGSYISLRYENAAGTVELAGMPGKAFGAHIWIEEAIFPAPKGGKAIDSPLVRSAGVVHMLGKCDTLYLASIQCRPELADFFGETYKRSCDIVEKWNAKKGE